MVTDISGTSILSNEFVVIGRANTDILGVLLEFGSARPIWPMWPQVAKSGSKNPKSERHEMELRSFHHWTRYGHPTIGQKWPRG